MADLFEGLGFKVKPRRPTEPIKREALIEDGCRFWLKRAWGAGPCILWAMCNPSDADAQRDDPTLLRVMEFSMAWGFGSCVVVNVIPLISSTPKAALDWARRVETMDHDSALFWQWSDNIFHCVDLIWKAQTRVAAWGNIIDPRFVRAWYQSIVESPDNPGDDEDVDPVTWACLGKTASGAPKHPLARGKHRVPAGFTPVPFTIS